MLTELAAYARGKCTLVAHVGAASTEDAVALARLAAREGYQAVSAVPPFYYKHAFDDIQGLLQSHRRCRRDAVDRLQYSGH